MLSFLAKAIMKWLPFIFPICFACVIINTWMKPSTEQAGHLNDIETTCRWHVYRFPFMFLHWFQVCGKVNAKETQPTIKTEWSSTGCLPSRCCIVCFILIAFPKPCSNAIFICPWGIEIVFMLIHNVFARKIHPEDVAPFQMACDSLNVGKHWIIYLIKTTVDALSTLTPLSQHKNHHLEANCFNTFNSSNELRSAPLFSLLKEINVIANNFCPRCCHRGLWQTLFYFPFHISKLKY